jgi:hypothetical protein
LFCELAHFQTLNCADSEELTRTTCIVFDVALHALGHTPLVLADSHATGVYVLRADALTRQRVGWADAQRRERQQHAPLHVAAAVGQRQQRRLERRLERHSRCRALRADRRHSYFLSSKSARSTRQVIAAKRTGNVTFNTGAVGKALLNW